MRLHSSFSTAGRNRESEFRTRPELTRHAAKARRSTAVSKPVRTGTAAPDGDRVGFQFANTEQLDRVITDVIQAELIGRAVEVACKIPHKVGSSCTLGTVTTLEFIEHHLTQAGHRNLL